MNTPQLLQVKHFHSITKSKLGNIKFCLLFYVDTLLFKKSQSSNMSKYSFQKPNFLANFLSSQLKKENYRTEHREVLSICNFHRIRISGCSGKNGRFYIRNLFQMSRWISAGKSAVTTRAGSVRDEELGRSEKTKEEIKVEKEMQEGWIWRS